MAHLGQFLRGGGWMIVHDRVRKNPIRSDNCIARLWSGDRQDLVMVHSGCEVDIPGYSPHLVHGVRLEHVLSVGATNHQGDGERIAEILVILVNLDERMI